MPSDMCCLSPTHVSGFTSCEIGCQVQRHKMPQFSVHEKSGCTWHVNKNVNCIGARDGYIMCDGHFDSFGMDASHFPRNYS